MPSFQYSALDSTGRSVDGLIDAAGRAQAIALLGQRSIYVTDIFNIKNAGACQLESARYLQKIRPLHSG